MEAVHALILENMFGSNIENIQKMLSMLSSTQGENYKLKLVLNSRSMNFVSARFLRKNKNNIKNATVATSVTKDVINNIKSKDVKQVLTYDNIQALLWTPVRSKNMTIIHNFSNNTSIVNVIIDKVFTSNQNSEINCTTELVVYKDHDTTVDDTCTCTIYERHIGEILEFNNPALANWQINCYGILSSPDYTSKKLHAQYDIYSCCNKMCVEFILKHISSSVRADVVALIDELYYRTDYKLYSVSYNVLNMFYKISADSIPNTYIMTQSTITSKAADSIFVTNKYDNTGLLIFHDIYVYLLTKSEYKFIAYNTGVLDNMPTSVFICKYNNSNNHIHIVDTMIIDGMLIHDAHDKRLRMIQEFVNSEYNKLVCESLDITVAKQLHYDSWEDVSDACISGISILYISNDHTIHYTINAKEDTRINLFVKRIPNTYKYILYNNVNCNDVINSYIYYNDYSQEQLKYVVSPMNHNTSNILGICDTPYFDSYIIDLLLLSNDIIKLAHTDINTVKQFIKKVISNEIEIDNTCISFTFVHYNNAYYWIPIEMISSNNIMEYTQVLLSMSSLYADIDLTDIISIDTLRNNDVLKLLNQYIIELYVSNESHDNIIDVFDDNDYIISSLYQIACPKCVIAINKNKYNIINYINILSRTIHEPNVTQLLKTTYNDTSNNINLKVFAYDFTNIRDNIYNGLINISSFTSNTVNVFIISNIHNNIFNSLFNIIELDKLLKYCLTQDGSVIIKFAENTSVNANTVHFVYHKQVYANDKFIQPIEQHELRYHGKSYFIHDIINDDYPLYSYIAYDSMDHTCELPCDKIIAYKLCKLFNIQIQFDATIFTRVLNKYVGNTEFDISCGAIANKMFMNIQANKSVLIANTHLSQQSIELIQERANKRITTLILTTDTEVLSHINNIVHLQEYIYVILPVHINEYYIKILQRIDLISITSMCDVMTKVFCNFGYKLTSICTPYTTKFFVNYIKSLNIVTNSESIKYFNSIYVAVFKQLTSC